MVDGAGAGAAVFVSAVFVSREAPGGTGAGSLAGRELCSETCRVARPRHAMRAARAAKAPNSMSATTTQTLFETGRAGEEWGEKAWRVELPGPVVRIEGTPARS